MFIFKHTLTRSENILLICYNVTQIQQLLRGCDTWLIFSFPFLSLFFWSIFKQIPI